MNAARNLREFFGRLRTMLKVDLLRMFATPTVYIMFGISFAIPVLILVMTASVGGMSEGGASAATFTNVWQAIGSASANGGTMSMDITTMCNMDLLFFLIAIFVCLFVGEDFRSGYVKNLFAVRAKKTDYVASKTVALFAAAVGMIALYFVGAMIGGKIAGLSFSAAEAGTSAGGIVACVVCKIFLAPVFISIALTLAAVGKQRVWISVACSLAAGMLLFMTLAIAAPLNAGALNAVMCAAGGAMFAVGLGAVSGVVLNKTNLV